MNGMIKITLGLMLAVMWQAGMAWAAPKIEVSIHAEKEIVVVEHGKEVIKRVKAEGIASGDVVFYILSFENKGDEVAKDVALVDPIPENTVFINNTAFGLGSDISYSIDGGKSYNQPSLLTYMVNGKKRTASPDQYTHIRWMVKTLEAGKIGMAGFQVRVK